MGHHRVAHDFFENVSTVLCVLMALQQFFLGYVYMYKFGRPIFRRLTGLTKDDLASMKESKASLWVESLLQNFGLFQWMLGAGLVWAVLDEKRQFVLQWFFILCICITSINAAFTLNAVFGVYQGLPAATAVCCLLIHSILAYFNTNNGFTGRKMKWAG